MRITRAESWVEHLELTRPYTIAFASFTHIELLFVRLETDEGFVGVGSGTPVRAITLETLEGAVAILAEKLEPLLVGQDARQLGGLLGKLRDELPANPAARASVDMALHDLFAQKLGLPLVEVLGRAHESLPTSITIGIKETVAEAVDEALEYRGRGFRILKIKAGSDLDQDLEVVAKVREAVGREMGIRVDANQGYSLADTERYFQAAKQLGIEFVEQPLPGEAAASMLELPEEIRLRSAADESLHSPAHALALAAAPQPFGIYNIKLMKCGGVGPALSIAEIARLAGIELMWGCMDESVVGIAAALHAALACPATRYLDLDGSLDLARDLATGGFVLEDGFLRTTEAPGLGVTLEDRA